jgi:hypothetical protein
MINCIDSIFTTPIYSRDKINPPKKNKNEMLLLFGNLLNKRTETNNSSKIYYGVEGHDNVHEEKQLYWLNKQIRINIKIYFNDLGIDNDLTKVSIENSHLSICYNNGGKVNLSKKSESHLTVFYCLRGDSNDSGKILFHSNNNIIKNISYDLDDDKNKHLSFISSKSSSSFYSGKLIIVPSSLEYEISPYYGKKHRFFLTYGVKFTSENNIKYM